MFATRFRNAALAFAGALVVATTLMTGVAAAAPVPAANTASAEAASAQPKLDPRVADLQVIRTDQGGTGALGQRAWASFLVKNNGPHSMTFNLSTSVTKRLMINDSYSKVVTNNTMSLASGASKPIDLKCDVDFLHECYYFIVQANQISGTDPNMQNNGADFAP